MLKTSLILLLICSTFSQDFKIEDNVHILTNDTFLPFISNTPESLIFFHEQNSPHLENVKQVWRELYKQTVKEHPNIKFATIDVQTNDHIKLHHDVEKSPQIRLYLNKGFFSFFEDEFNLANLHQFIDFHLKTLAEPTFVESDRAFVRYTNKANSIILAFHQVTPLEIDFVLGLQRVVPDIPVYYILGSSKYAYMTFPEDSSKSIYRLKMKRNFDEGDKFLGVKEMFQPRHILQLVWPLRKSRIEVFSEKHLKLILGAKKQAIILFDDDYNSDASEHFSKVILSQDFNGLAVKCTLAEQGSDKLRHLFGISESDFPTVRIIKWDKNLPLKFQISDIPNQTNLEKFLSEFKDNKLSDYKKSQPNQDNSGRKVFHLNRAAFYAQVNDNKTNFVIGFIGKQAGPTEAFFEATLSLLKNPNEFVFALIDVNLNDIDGFNRKTVPLIQILTKVQRKKPVTYSGEESAQAFSEYLNTNIDFSDEL